MMLKPVIYRSSLSYVLPLDAYHGRKCGNDNDIKRLDDIERFVDALLEQGRALATTDLVVFSIGRVIQQGAIISLVIAGYLAFQHFSQTGSLQKASDQGSLVTTLAIICLTAASSFLLR
ncbi:hypothetical protein FEM48_Zijuj01G0058300 [Ziziphus jujuba var. spinosa]|uniref:Uncharacterized protein n=1 Tax=Ziziphus jujuba var. spinosa TaxID=714518 RepID=A0A978VZH5_ZIZJJ|nr:hypothetical protein FEM48_Zijuj01G0058300 [Ziziphus jujuba var. spinosa]